MSMDNEQLVYKLLARALLDIRIASDEDNSRVSFELSDLFHNVPYQLARIRQDNGDYSEIIEWLKMRCEQKNMSKWLENVISECS
jgi:hypothetical protein